MKTQLIVLQVKFQDHRADNGATPDTWDWASLICDEMNADEEPETATVLAAGPVAEGPPAAATWLTVSRDEADDKKVRTWVADDEEHVREQFMDAQLGEDLVEVRRAQNHQFSTLRTIRVWDLPGEPERLRQEDIQLTYGDGVALYNKAETRNEIENHHDDNPDADNDYSRLLEEVEALPEDVLIEW